MSPQAQMPSAPAGAPAQRFPGKRGSTASPPGACTVAGAPVSSAPRAQHELEVEPGVRVVQRVPEELPQASHPVAHCLRMHAQLRGDRRALTPMREPGEQGCLLYTSPSPRD